MLRHIKIILVALLVVAAVPAFSGEASPVETVVSELADQGYEVARVSRTFWGRVKIVARKDDLEREVILNPKTGEILRDLVRRRRAGQGSDGSGSGTLGDAEDDDEKDDDKSGDDSSGSHDSSGSDEPDGADEPDDSDDPDEDDEPDDN